MVVDRAVEPNGEGEVEVTLELTPTPSRHALARLTEARPGSYFTLLVAGLAQLVERRLPKPKVAGSRPVSRSQNRLP